MGPKDPQLEAHQRPRDDATIVYDPSDGDDSDVQRAPELGAARDGFSPLGLPIAFGRFKVKGELGRGGMGVVYRGFEASTGDVAIKVMSAEHTIKPRLVQRFMREFKICQMLNHPNIARALSYGRGDDESIFFVMEYVAGLSLDDIIEAGELTLGKTIDIVRQACLGMAHAHEHGVVHRDIKPGNIIVRDDGSVSIIDFGIAGKEDEGGEKKNVTVEGCVMGTPYYMSPEQGKGLADTDQRTDIYAIGICLYEMISGRTPSGLLSPDAVPEGLGHIIGRATAYNRDRRYPDMNSLVAALDGYLAKGQVESDSRALLDVGDSTRLRETMIELLFPKSIPTIPGIQVGCLYLPAAGVGGNYYDFIEIDGSSVGLLVGNLGQRPNLESMVFLSMVRAAFRLSALGENDPASALSKTNAFMAREGLDCFAVFSYAVIDPVRRTLRVATAGFRPSGILREGRDDFEVVGTPGLGLGIVDDAEYESVMVPLDPGDIVAFTSMGVIKTQDRSGEALGQDRFERTIRANRDKTAEGITAALKQRISRYSGGVAQADDMTICILKVE